MNLAEKAGHSAAQNASKKSINQAINKATKTLGLFVLIGLVAQYAHADRYLVVLKNQSSFNKVHAQLMLANTTRLDGTSLFGSLPMQANVQVEDSLVKVKTLVVNGEADVIESLASNPDVALVEKEFFHPAPAPVAGYRLTQPWDYNLKAELALQNHLQGNPVVAEKTPYGIIMVKAPEAWAKGYQGQNTKVLILDTGIDRDHPALKTQIELGKDFVGDNQAPYDIADKVGHGSHVAGTIAGLPLADGFSGVAPQTHLLIGRVCSELGCSNVSVTKGINWGASQGVDVISMSLGGPVGSAAEQAAVEAAAKAGVSIVAASGNDGTAKVSFPAAFPTVIAVGAVDKTSTKAKFSQWGPELAVVGPGVDVTSSVPHGTGRETEVTITLNGKTKQVLATTFQGSPESPKGASGELAYAGLGKPEELTGKVSGKFALIKRGELKFIEKVKNAIAAGATGVVIFNNEPGLIQGAITPDGSILSIPVVMIEQTTGENLQASLDAGGNASALIKTTPSDYASMSGTSMATPHVSGVVALIKSANKKLTPAQVKSVLTSTCKALGPNTNNEYGKGLVDSENAVVKAASIR